MHNTVALDFRRKPAGAAPRFGSAHVRLSGQTLQRTTFCYPDSVFEPVQFGVAARMFLIDNARADDKDALGDYIEAQVHGPVRLGMMLRPLSSIRLPRHRLWRRWPSRCPAQSNGTTDSGSRLTTYAVIPDYRGATACGLGQDAR
jgi:hypothetical protein